MEASQKGSHVKFVRRSGEGVDTTVVPKKSDIPVGTLRSILHQAHSIRHILIRTIGKSSANRIPVRLLFPGPSRLCNLPFPPPY